MTEQITKGYKVTNSEMKCRTFQYEIDKVFEHTGKLSLCGSGFHFCIIVGDCFNYYEFNSSNRVFEVEAYGDLISDGDKSCTSKIKLLRELTWLEVLTLVNSGKDNTGHTNSGDSNSGAWNSGDRNSGYRNSGDRNSGDRNSGDSNSGYRNSGYRNSGDSNSGDSNSGDSNSGYRNSGDSNSGAWNSGDRNSGYRNSGDRNSGYRNSGDSNSGDRNSGDRNSGYWNSGDRNSGDSNSGYRNSGAFSTDSNPFLVLFDLPTNIRVRDWEQMEVCQLMYNIDPTIWVPMSIMTDEEKAAHPKYETPEGYLKTIPIHEAWANFWGNLVDDKKKLFSDLPNFDADKFKQITGITI